MGISTRACVVTVVLVLALAAVTVVGAPAVQAADASAANTPWPQFQGNAAHTGFNPAETILNTSNVSGLAVKSIGALGGDTFFSSPVVGDGSVYVASLGEGLLVFPQAGCRTLQCQPSWQGTTGPQALASPALANGLVFVNSQATPTSNAGRVSVFNAHGCGQRGCLPLWQDTNDGPFAISSPAISGGVLYVESADGKVLAYAAGGCGAAQCAPLWTDDAGGSFDGSPAVAGGFVYAAAEDGTLVVFDAHGCGAAVCEPLWTAPLGGKSFVASPAVAGGRVFVGNGKALYAIDANGCGAAVCKPLWRGPAVATGGTPAVANGIVYIDAQPSNPRSLAVNAIEAFDGRGCGRPTCAPLWTGMNFQAGGESSPVVANGVVYLGKGPASPSLHDSGVLSYDAAGCGRHLCKPLGLAQTGPVQLYFESTPAVADGRVYMGSGDESAEGLGGFYIFELPAAAATAAGRR